MNLNQVKKAMPYLFKNKITGNLIGTHGVGKSTAVREYCEENGLGFIDLRLGQMEVGDLLGLPTETTDKDGNKVMVFARPKWFPTSGKGVLFLDEINRSKRDVIQAIFQLVLDRKLHDYELPEGWNTIAAMNPSTDDYTTLDLSDKALMDRFCHIKITSSFQDFIDYGTAKGFNRSVLGFISNHPGMLRGQTEDFSLNMVQPSDRSWAAVGRLSDDKDMPEDILNELVSGIVGVEAATAFLTWKKKAEKPIEGMEVLNHYKKVSDRIKEQASSENYRPDLLNETKSQIVAHLFTLDDEKKVELKDKQYNNMVAFVLDLPSDLFVDFFSRLFKTEDKRIPISLMNKICKDEQIQARAEIEYVKKQATQSVQKEA